ncbi:MAG: efflux RND transporter periplasmic adaptor subunit [Thermoguttaceae bacterium]
MTISARRFAKYALIAVGVVSAGAAATPRLIRYLSPPAAKEAPDAVVQLAAGKDAICLPPELAANLGIQTCTIETSSSPVTLEMSGTLMLDADRLSHVHARFPGEIVELGPGDGRSPAVCFGQRVRKGQLLAVIWSRDLGEKKSDLIDALSQLRVDEDSLARISKAAAEGSVPERILRDTERKVEADRIAVSRAVRTLQSWRISKEEIDHVRAEADRLARAKTPDREEMVAQWAKLEVLAPLDGTVIERNVALGDLVDTNIDLFKIADLSRLRVVAHAYEEDLPSLDALKDDRRAWSVSVGSGPDAATRPGRFDQVGCIIDPNQHTALVMGWVDNPDGRLRVGQFVTVHLEIPPPKSEVVIPAAALCEEGGRTTVFVHPEGTQDYVRRQVIVSRRNGDKVYLRSQVTAEERQRGLEPLPAGQLVVTSRIAQLTASLNELNSAGKSTADKPGA